MISFIVIGKNESEYLGRCFNSINKTIEANGLKYFEIIFIDANSKDNSIEVAKSYPNIRIFKLTNNDNPGAARNIGAKVSKGDILFFIDGDMEIEPGFISCVYKDEKLFFPFVTGEFLYLNYSYSSKLIDIENYHYNKKKYIEQSTKTNGCFLIEKKVWELADGMDSKLFASEDLDLVFRLRKMGIYLHRIQRQLGKHHTVSAKTLKRSFIQLFNGRVNKQKALITKKHFLYLPYLKDFSRSDYTFLIGIISSVASIVFDKWYILLVYPLSVIIRLLIRDRFNLLTLLPFLVYFFLRDTSLLVCLFLCFPRVKTEEYLVIRDF